jgi:hypothetical protein
MEWATSEEWPDFEDEGKRVEIERHDGATVGGLLEGLELYPPDVDMPPMFLVVSDDGTQYPFEVHRRWRFV